MKKNCIVIVSFLIAAFPSIILSKPGRYLTYVGDDGQIKNVTVDLSHVPHLDGNAAFESRKRLVLSDFTEENKELSSLLANKAPLNPDENRQRYYTWVDPKGRVQNSFYADQSDLPEQGKDFVLPTGDLASDFISSDVFEGQGFQKQDEDSYYTWTDATGRTHNTYLTPQERSSVFSRSQQDEAKYTQGNEIILNAYASESIQTGMDDSGRAVNLGKALSQLMSSDEINLSHSNKEELLARELNLRCCAGITGFNPIHPDKPEFDEINRFSPSYEFPTGESYYSAFKLPVSQRSYGLRIRSFADKNLFYPTLLFLDANKKPTRLITHAIYRLHPENWHRHAFIEGVVKIKPSDRERYVVLFTTPDDLNEETLDHKPFPLNVTIKDKNEDFKTHEHTRTGSFEIAVVR